MCHDVGVYSTTFQDRPWLRYISCYSMIFLDMPWRWSILNDLPRQTVITLYSIPFHDIARYSSSARPIQSKFNGKPSQSLPNCEVPWKNHINVFRLGDAHGCFCGHICLQKRQIWYIFYSSVKIQWRALPIPSKLWNPLETSYKCHAPRQYTWWFPGSHFFMKL